MDSGTVAIIVASIGAGGIFTELVKGIAKTVKGKHHTEQTFIKQRDYQARKRYQMEEYAHALRQDLLKQGVRLEDIRPWPDL